MRLVSNEIQDKINRLDKCREALLPVAQKKAEKMSEYDKVLAKTIIALRNGRTFELDGEQVSSPPVSIIEKIAKGLCWEVKLEADTAEGEWKALQSTIGVLETQLNGYQSISRHQMEV